MTSEEATYIAGIIDGEGSIKDKPCETSKLICTKTPVSGRYGAN